VISRWPNALSHHVLIPSQGGVLQKLIPFQQLMDEPFHSPNMILNQDIWQSMVGQGIRVSLNGAGGDEVFAGYASEYLGPYALSLLKKGQWQKAYQLLWKNSERENTSVREIARMAWQLLPGAWRNQVKSPWPKPELDPLVSDLPMPIASDEIETRMLQHLTDYKMNYWLRSGNTSFMGIPIEVRLPLLDAGVVEWGSQMPLEYLMRDGWMKWVLRKAVDEVLPREVTWRKVKMGFPFPLQAWLAASESAFQILKLGEAPPFLNRDKLFQNYSALNEKHSAYLWRCLSTLLWWQTCVQEKELVFPLTD